MDRDASCMEAAFLMSTSLNFVDELLTLGQRYQDAGRVRDAVRVLTSLAGMRKLPAAQAIAIHGRLAEIYLKRRRFQKARRHLTILLRYKPDNARTHYLMATAALAEDRGDFDRALEHFQQSIELDPTQPRCLVECGMLQIRRDQIEEGVSQLRQAVELAPDEIEVVTRAVKGLRLAGMADEARKLLKAALFRNSRDARFRKLWNEYQFHQLRQRQEVQRHRPEAGPECDDDAILLPFLRAEIEKSLPTGTRQDGPSTLPRPHFAPSKRRSDQRRIQ